jgi:hypothetical protein
MTTASYPLIRVLSLASLAALVSCSDSRVEAKAPSPRSADAAAKRPTRSRTDDLPVGRWFPLRAATDGPRDSTPKEIAREGDLSALGYAGAYEKSDGRSGAIVHDASRMEPGLTLHCSGHDTSVMLIDAEGAVVHHWHIDYDEVFPDPLPEVVQEFHSEFVRRAWPFPNGDLLAIFEYTGITRVDADGKPLWALANLSHHDFKILGNGTIVTLDVARRSFDWMRKQYKIRRFRKGVMDSHVVFIAPDGEILRKFSIFEAILRSPFASFLNTITPTSEDIFHANSVDVLDAAAAEAFPLFGAGDVLVSLRNPSALAVFDGRTEKLKWLHRGVPTAQHQASFLGTGSILMFDNAGANEKFPLRCNRSRAVEIDPVTHQPVWQYPPLGRRADLYSEMLGYVERLPGGNTLITESMQGHLLEVTPAGDLVWEYYSPYRAGDEDEFITTLMGARRIPRSALPFLDE